MMGNQGAGQERLFYAFNLGDHVPRDPLLRGIDHFLDLSELRRHLADFYSHTGRPSIDPELMIRMLVIGYCFGIRSARRLCEEAHLNLAYRWFCRLGLEDKVPDHSSLSKNRHGRFRDSAAFRRVFETVLRRCMSEGLVAGEGLAIDASVIKADAAYTQFCEHYKAFAKTLKRSGSACLNSIPRFISGRLCAVCQRCRVNGMDTPFHWRPPAVKV